jgi:tRNA G10  N-methylase Trm11
MFLGAVALALLAYESVARRLEFAFASGGIITTSQAAEDRASIGCSSVRAENGMHDDKLNPRPQQMVIFRAPSRHTYGFIDGTTYDLPEIELRELMSSMATSENLGIQFIPVDTTSDDYNIMPKRNYARPELQNIQPKSQRQLKKKIPGNSIPQNNCLLHWIVCSDDVIANDDLARAASRAVLTHATFLIHEKLHIADEDWQDASSNRCNVGNHHPLVNLLEQLDVIDVSNPNMSRDDRHQLLETIVCIIEREHDLKCRLQQLYSVHSSPPSTHDVQYQSPVLIHRGFLAPTRGQDEVNLSHHHCIYFGRRTAIGLAGTSGAPSQTLRRPQRGILKEYALKNRQFTNLDNALKTSTAMEPEIGFLMANLAWAGSRETSAGSSILDPCCGSGRLLLYAGALGATRLTGIDCDSCVWKDSVHEFRNHRTVGSSRSSPIPVPVFYPGDVHNPSLTDALCTPNSIDGIICDPPYNIGAPVLVDGKDVRPKNYHRDKEGRSDLEIDDETVCQTSGMVTIDDIVPSILAVAQTVLVNGGRIVFFLPVRGEEMTLALEELLSKRGWLGCGNNSKQKESDCCLRLVKHSSRKQMFSPTFCRWLVCMKKTVSSEKMSDVQLATSFCKRSEQ